MKISPFMSGAAVAVTLLALTLILDTQERQRQAELQQAAVVQELRLLTARVESLLDKYLYLGSGIAAYVATHPDVSARDFSALMQRLAEGDALLLGMVLLREGQPSHVYAAPPRLTPTAAGAVLRLVRPVTLPDSGGTRLWGMMEIDLDRNELLARAGLPRPGTAVEIAVRNENGRLLAGTAAVFAAAQAQGAITFPDGRWELAGRITAAAVDWPWLLMLGTVIAVLAGLLTWWLRQEQMATHRLALHDCLTGLPNRRLLQDRVQQSCAAAARSRRQLVLMYLDLDNFKPVNDTYGHHAGDAVLCAVAQRLKHCVRRSDTVARVSGDEFVLVLEDLAEAREAEAVADKVLAMFARPIMVGEHAFVLGCSIGLVAMEAGCDVDEALVRADNAMYQAKRDGKNSYRWYVNEPEPLKLEVATETAV
ncbi:GGDEF domain-containing protein [Sulfurivermis fontis]|uniref:GGDEF domain-containing protein n=1 Tax=Sulfurivermis fontis TaxID=1972068 RepID=UPI000FD90E96|nr:GGDEF domain-containing protein [Sulfurivermis fontis]